MILATILIVGLSVSSLQQPPDRAAAMEAVSNRLAKNDLAGALASYDAFVSASKQPDGDLLNQIATAELRRLAAHGGTAGSLIALEQLARQGDAEALEQIRRAAALNAETTDLALAPYLSLVRLGDASALKRVSVLLRTAPSAARVTVIRALREAGAREQARLLVPLIDEPDQPVRHAAMLALGAFQHRPAAERLRAVAAGDHPVDRMVAAIALKHMGDQSMDPQVEPLLGSILPEVRLMAAEAYGASGAAKWLSRIRELGSDANELNRVRAAEVLACCDRPAALGMLVAALDSELPSIRGRAAHVLADKGLADLKLARRLLGSRDDDVRAWGAVATVTMKSPRRP